MRLLFVWHYREICGEHSPLGGRASARSPPNVAPRTRLPISLRFLHSQDTRSVPLQPPTFSTYQVASSQAEALPHYPPVPDSHICSASSSHIYPFPGFQAARLPSCQISRGSKLDDSHIVGPLVFPRPSDSKWAGPRVD